MSDSSAFNVTAIQQLAAALSPEQRQQAEVRIANAGKVWEGTFKIAIGFLFGLAVLAFFGRITIRLWAHRRLYRDDAILSLAFATLVTATAVFYKRARAIYLIFGLTRGDEIITLVAAEEISNVFNQLDWSFAYITGLWTTIFAVKVCYIAFFRTLIQSMPVALVRYYWFVLAFTLLAWAYLVLQQLISCPYFGASSSKCFPALPVSPAVMTFTFWSGPILDALTDATLVAIPIIVLRKSQMALLTKIGVGIFLCLSFVMIAASIIRAAGTYFRGALDTPWQVFWLHAEGCISVLMASFTVYRSVLVGPGIHSGRIQQFFEHLIRLRTTEAHVESRTLTMRLRFARFLFSKIPTATLTGLVTMFAETNKYDPATDLSTRDMTAEMGYADYHKQLKNMQSNDTQNRVLDSREGNLSSTCAASEPENVPHSEAPPSKVPVILLRMLFPHSHRAVLQHRSIGEGHADAGNRSENPVEYHRRLSDASE